MAPTKFDDAMVSFFLAMMPWYLIALLVVKVLKWLHGPPTSMRLRGGDDFVVAKQRSLKKALALEAVGEWARRGLGAK